MSLDIREPDWKVLRDVEPLALDRLCEQILSEVTKVASDPDIGAHARYGKVYKLIHKCDKDIADAFDGLSRSNALLKLGIMVHLGLIAPGELSRFSENVHDFLARLRSLRD